jgi:hypothetical protein
MALNGFEPLHDGVVQFNVAVIDRDFKIVAAISSLKTIRYQLEELVLLRGLQEETRGMRALPGQQNI